MDPRNETAEDLRHETAEDLQSALDRARLLFEAQGASALTDVGVITSVDGLSEADRFAAMNRLIDLYATVEGNPGSSILAAIRAVGGALNCGSNPFATPYQLVANLKRQQAMMAGPRGEAMRRAREHDFALGDEVLLAEAACPDAPARARVTQAVREVAGRTGKRIGDVRSLRRLAASFPPGHEARTHPRMPGSLLECLGNMNAPDRDRWYPRFAGGWQPCFEAAETWEELFYAIFPTLSKYR